MEKGINMNSSFVWMIVIILFVGLDAAKAFSDADTVLLFGNATGVVCLYLNASLPVGARSIPMEGTRTIFIDYHHNSSAIYLTNLAHDGNSIRKIALDGSENEILLTQEEGAEGIAIDWVAQNIYWVTPKSKKISVSRLDGSSSMDVLTGLDLPRAVNVDPANGYMYWSSWGKEPAIERAFLDGTGREAIVTEDLGFPNGLALDLEERKLYWGDAKLDRIEVSDLDGSNRKALIQDGVDHPFGIAVLGDDLFWSDWRMKRVERADKHTGGDRRIMYLDEWPVMGVKAVDLNSLPAGTNTCGGDNGGCSHLCLYRPPPLTHVCACPDGMKLLQNTQGLGGICQQNTSDVVTVNGTDIDGNETGGSSNQSVGFNMTDAGLIATNCEVLNETSQALNQTDMAMNATKEDFNRTEEILNQSIVIGLGANVTVPDMTTPETGNSIVTTEIPAGPTDHQNEVFNETSQALNKTEMALNATKEDFNRTEEILNQTTTIDLAANVTVPDLTKPETEHQNEVFNETSQALNQTEMALNATIEDFNRTQEILNQTTTIDLGANVTVPDMTTPETEQKNDVFNETIQALNQTEMVLNATKEDFNRTEEILNQTTTIDLGANVTVPDLIKEDLNRTEATLNQTFVDSSNSTDIGVNVTVADFTTPETVNNTFTTETPVETTESQNDVINETSQALNQTEMALNVTEEDFNRTFTYVNQTVIDANRTDTGANVTVPDFIAPETGDSVETTETPADPTEIPPVCPCDKPQSKNSIIDQFCGKDITVVLRATVKRIKVLNTTLELEFRAKKKIYKGEDAAISRKLKAVVWADYPCTCSDVIKRGKTYLFMGRVEEQDMMVASSVTPASGRTYRKGLRAIQKKNACVAYMWSTMQAQWAKLARLSIGSDSE